MQIASCSIKAMGSLFSITFLLTFFEINIADFLAIGMKIQNHFPGSKLSNESQYYKGEALFYLKEYDEAWSSYDRYIKFSNDLIKIEKSRYRICECAILSSNSYQRDQDKTKQALEQLQMFIEDFHQSEFIKDS